MIKGYTFINLLLRGLSEFKYPQNYFLRNIKEILFSNYIFSLDANTKKINLLYDLNFESPTFDLAYSLFIIDKYSKKNNLTFRVIIIKRKRKDYKSWYPISVSQLNKRINAMLVPISNSFYNCYETIVLDDIKDIIIYEKESFFSYNLSKRIVPFLYNDLHEYVLKSSEYDGIKLKKSLIEKIKKNISVLNHPLNTNKIITITLRSYFYEVERDSDIEFWLKVANYYKKLSYHIFIIPDTDNINDRKHREKFCEYKFLDECAKIMDSRMAIYEIAKLNFFPHSGTAAAAQINKNAASITHFRTHNHMYNLSDKFFTEIGSPPGKNYKFFTKNHLIYWNGNLDGLIKEANKLLEI
jgi:hypothetical protein|tara:strand:+ start:4142 stop:5203 length:1062 start_codon:yes stop_codon:yes gene_type:complete